jgi:hypothetical protein
MEPLEPLRSIPSNKTFDEKYKKSLEASKEKIKCIFEYKLFNYDYEDGENEENNLMDSIKIWTCIHEGMPYEFWDIPLNKPICIPKYVFEVAKKFLERGIRLLNQDEQV